MCFHIPLFFKSGGLRRDESLFNSVADGTLATDAVSKLQMETAISDAIAAIPAVDAYTESKIQEALDHLLANRTSIVIAHRLSTVLSADRIIVLDHGKITEQGSHDQLMKSGGKYQELYETYFKHQALVSSEIRVGND